MKIHFLILINFLVILFYDRFTFFLLSSKWRGEPCSPAPSKSALVTTTSKIRFNSSLNVSPRIPVAFFTVINELYELEIFEKVNFVWQSLLHLDNACVRRYCKFLLFFEFLALFIILTVQCIISSLADMCSMEADTFFPKPTLKFELFLTINIWCVRVYFLRS